jgi:hypothetical protein
MAQISRPFQIALAALALFVLAWFAVLHRPGSSESTGSSGSGAAPSSATAVSHETARGTGHSTSAPAKQAASTQHRHATAAHHQTHVSRTHAVVTHHAKHVHVVHVGASHTTAKHAHPARPAPQAPATHGAPLLQAAVASELGHGKVVLLLFWNPHSSSDAAVHGEVQSVAHKLGRQVAVHTAAAGQIGQFGSITRDIQVYQTPTLLIVNKHRQVTTVTGYTDAYSLEQTIREARG